MAFGIILLAAVFLWREPAGIFLPLNLATFFCIALACHAELARRRPPAARLTEFYLFLSLGGLVGGVSVALVAPLVFDSVLEYPLCLALAAALLPIRGIGRDRLPRRTERRCAGRPGRDERRRSGGRGCAGRQGSARRHRANAAASIARAAPDQVLAGDVEALADGLGRYAASPTDEAKGRLSAIVDRLDGRRDAMPADQAVAFGNFLSHARILLDRQGPTEQIFRQATSGEVTDLAGELAAQFDVQADTLAAQADSYMMGLWGAGGALLAVWVFVAAVRSRPMPSARPVEADPGAADAVAALPPPAVAAATNGSAVHHEAPRTPGA